jgi:beta-mannosidase
MAERTRDYDSGQNLLLDRRLYYRALKLDRTRYVHMNSGTGDFHVYPGWYYGSYRDFSDLPGAPFPTEFGCQALPEVESLKRFILPESLWPVEGKNSAIWEFHNLQIRELFQIAKIAGDSIEELARNSQKYQAWLLKYAIERYRLAKYEKISGLFQFMFSDCWPSVTWSVVDYYRKPKEGYWALRNAFQPVLPIAVVENSPNNYAYARIYVVNDLSRDIQGLLKWRLE